MGRRHNGRLRGIFLIATGALLAARIGTASPPDAATSQARPPAEIGPAVPGLYLKHGFVDTSQPADVAEVLAAMSAPRDASRPVRLVVQLDGPIDPARRQRLRQAGLTPQGYLPDNAFIVRVDQTDAARVAGLDFVRWAGPFQREWKLDPDLGRRVPQTAERRQLIDQGKRPVVVVLFPGEDPGLSVNDLLRAGADVSHRTLAGRQWMIDAIVPAASLDRLADLPGVQFVEEAPELAPRNNTNEWILQTNVTNDTRLWDVGLLGQGQIADLIDWTPRTSHCAFSDSVPIGPSHRKVVALRNAGSVSSHGTHTAGTIAGDSGTWGVPDPYDGMAPAARISFSNAQNIYNAPSTFYARLVDAHNDGAHAHSNSWGDDGTTAYTTWCQQIDAFSHDYEDDFVAFAVTNTSTLKTPENAKNVLGVGASQDTPNQDYHCSGGQGPTADGRRKPEVYAPGCSTNSANSATTCGIRTMTGTSMACPAVVGASLLVRQYFDEGFYPTGAAVPEHGFSPSGALLRAILILSSVDMTGISGYPSNQEGWGRLLLDEGLYLPGDAARLWVRDLRNADGFVTVGEQTSHLFTVLGSGQPLHVTMVFTDPPAAVNATSPVVNNLDLEVHGPGGLVYRGNVFSSGQSNTGGATDRYNTVEQVLLRTPTPGVYEVIVRAAGINEGPQGYALAVTGDMLATPADCTQDWTVGLDDLEPFTSCLSGPDSSAMSGCQCADTDGDEDVDLRDFQSLQLGFGQ